MNMNIVNLKNHNEINEAWVQNIIAENPNLLGLGDVELLQLERKQPRAGRLDFLFRELNGNRIYEIELQLGKTDESHIIRTIEYWDIERKRYPQYEHVAVIIAENITSRFLNVISLFNGNIPIIALQMSAIQIENKIGLHFVKVLDESLMKEIDDEIETVHQPTDRGFWEETASKETVSLADSILNLIKKCDNGYNLKYNKHYIGLEKSGISNNFIFFKPKKRLIKAMFKMESDPEFEEQMEAASLDYEYKNALYTLKLNQDDLINRQEIIESLVQRAYQYFIK